MQKRVTEITPIYNPLCQKIRVAVYARVSCEKDTMVHSLKAQIDYYRKYIANNPEWTFAGVYADEAKTGTKDSRQEFQDLLSKCRSGEIDMIITKSISRFARNTVTLLETVRELKTMGINVFFEDQNIYSLSEEGEMMLTLLAGVAQEESFDCSESVKWRVRKKYERGEPTSFTMLGYRLVDGEIVVVDEEVSLVKRIFEMYLSGLGTQKISNILGEEGIVTRTIQKWSRSTVTSILKNEKYKGDLRLQKSYVVDHITKKKVINKGQLPQYYVEGNHDYIIEPNVFDEVQRILASRVHHNVKPPEITCFSAKLVCANCGASYTRKKVNGIVKWQCRTFDRKGKRYCASKAIRDDILRDASARALNLRTINEDLFTSLVDHIEVCNGNILRFIFKDGTRKEITWQDHSRRDSWTFEKRQLARERSLIQHGK